MQVNSAQDYLTRYKRRVIATTFYSTPPEQKDRTNGVVLSALVNSAQIRQLHQAPTVVSAWGGVPGGATYFSLCGNCARGTGAPGTFQVINTKDIVSRQALRPIGVRSTISQQ